MKIKKGDWFKCRKTFKTWKGDLYIYGKLYFSEIDGCITDESGIKDDVWNEGSVKEYFVKIYTIQDFLAQLPKKQEEAWEPKVGEKVEFKSFTSSTEWSVAEYLATDKRCKEPYALTYTSSRTGSKLILTCPIIRQIPKKIKVTKQEIADKMGIELNQLEII